LDFVNFGGFREFRFLDPPCTRCGELWCGSGYDHWSVKITNMIPIGVFNLRWQYHRLVEITEKVKITDWWF